MPRAAAKVVEEENKEVITLTFGDMAENHVGMEQIGELVAPGEGFQVSDINSIRDYMESLGAKCEMVNLSAESTELPSAYVLIIRDGVNILLGPNAHNRMFEEQCRLRFDEHALMYGRVVKKHARKNLCYDNLSREPDYENGKGRIVGYSEIPIMKNLMDKFEDNFGNKARNLKVESNYYYDASKCGIGFHGDSERRKVIGVRLGNTPDSLPLHYQWYLRGEPVFERIILNLNAGDIYIMSEKAVGTDWKKRVVYTVRHATGCDKYVK